MKKQHKASLMFCCAPPSFQWPSRAYEMRAADAGKGNPTYPAEMPVGARAIATAKDLRKARAKPAPSDCHLRVNTQTSTQRIITPTNHMRSCILSERATGQREPVEPAARF